MDIVAYIEEHVTRNNVHIQIEEESALVQGGCAEGGGNIKTSVQDIFKTLSYVKHIPLRNTPKVKVAHEIPKQIPTDSTFEDKLLRILMEAHDPSSTLYQDAEYHSRLKQFVSSMVNDLENDKQLYKKLGYSRKKTFTSCQGLQANLVSMTNYSIDTLDYVAKYNSFRLVVINMTDKSRDDINDTVEDKCLYHIIDTLELSPEFIDLQKLNRIAWATFIKHHDLKISSNAKDLKIADLKTYLKIRGQKIKGSKEELFNSIQEQI
jgi:hypothetical protein